MTSWIVHRVDGGWRLPIEQRCVSRCILDHAFVLEFHEGQEIAIVRIEGAFTIHDQGRAFRLNPACPLELGPALALFGKVVHSAMASAGGTLDLVLGEGVNLSVEPDAHYEAWEVAGPGGMRAVCTPGGAVSVWQPDDDLPRQP